MSRLREEAGLTLIELMLVSTLMMIVLGATLTAFESFQSNAAENERQTIAQDQARRSIDSLARDLRNLASPVPYDPDSVKRMDPGDLIVQSVGPTRDADSLNSRNTQYVRYCYDTATKTIHRQTLTWKTVAAPAVPTATNCAGAAGWTQDLTVAEYIVNGARPIFTYNSAEPRSVTEIHTVLWVDIDTAHRPKEVTISTTVFLRNQNKSPIARFSADPAAATGSILLNATNSEDPEERALTYNWYDADLTDCAAAPAIGPAPSGHPGCLVGNGIVLTYTPPAPGTRHVYLQVQDPGSLESYADIQEVCVPGGAGC